MLPKPQAFRLIIGLLVFVAVAVAHAQFPGAMDDSALPRTDAVAASAAPAAAGSTGWVTSTWHQFMG
ncbi:MAG: hypothetical protein O3A51_05325, partial [Verrucomicrobia bacterium]|nr:hypothetical protein [Verrucomicrobiota bacterium]